MSADFYCGTVPAGVWPFAEPLVIELEVGRDSYLVAGVYTNANLPGLKRFLRQRIRGLPISEVGWLSADKGNDVYHADYWKWIQAALIFAVKAFKEDEGRQEDYFASLRHTRILGHLVPFEQDRRAG